MRSVKAGREPRGRRFRTPRRKARCLSARRSRRCPSTALVAWGDAVISPVTGKVVAARFRRGDVSLKPQHEPDAGDAGDGRGGSATRPCATQGISGIQGLDEPFPYPEQVGPASSCGTARARTRGNEPSDGVRDANGTRAPGRRSGDVGSARALWRNKKLSNCGPKAAAMPRKPVPFGTKGTRR